MTETSRLPLVDEMAFDGFQGARCPVLQPAIARRFVLTHLALEIASNARNDEWMPFAGRDQREAPHSCAAPCVAGQQRGLWMRFLQVFEDRYRLEQRWTVIDGQCGHDALRIDRAILGIVLLAMQQVD